VGGGVRRGGGGGCLVGGCVVLDMCISHPVYHGEVCGGFSLLPVLPEIVVWQ
jgi:hypothetical protein